MIRQLGRDDDYHLDDILHICLKHIKPVTMPLALITQLPYSGGSLLSRLFDGHCHLHAYPGVLIPGHIARESWPSIDLSRPPEEWLKTISNHFDLKTFRAGFKPDEKGGQSIPHIFLPVIQERIFLKYLASLATINTRDVFDAWMTGCFGAWLNYQNHGHDKKFITALTPALTTQSANVDSLFDIYPEGRLIALIREPAQWYAAASKRELQLYGSIDTALNRWRDYTRGLLETRNKFADRIFLIKFEDLINRTDRVMQHLAAFLEISFEESLLVPTFNGYPIQTGSDRGSAHLDRNHQQLNESVGLDKNQLDTIEQMTAADYQSALQQTAAVD